MGFKGCLAPLPGTVRAVFPGTEGGTRTAETICQNRFCSTVLKHRNPPWPTGTARTENQKRWNRSTPNRSTMDLVGMPFILQKTSYHSRFLIFLRANCRKKGFPAGKCIFLLKKCNFLQKKNTHTFLQQNALSCGKRTFLQKNAVVFLGGVGGRVRKEQAMARGLQASRIKNASQL